MEKKKHKKAKKVLLILACVIVIIALGVFVLLKMTFLKSFPKLTGEQFELELPLGKRAGRA